MPLDYSKWDALELSDDSDIEVHPNVDKRSFIRAKQNQIHMERARRKHEIETLKYERIINDGLMKRISALLASLHSHAADTQSRNPVEVAFQAVMESARSLRAEDDRLPPRPAGVHSEDKDEVPTYSKMMATLLDQINKGMEERKVTHDERYGAITAEIEEHLSKVKSLQAELEKKLAQLEKEEKSKITSESIHTGFDSSHVNKASTPSAPAAAGSSSAGTKPELLNPDFDTSAGGALATKKSAATIGDDEELEASPAGRQFAAIKPGEYKTSMQFMTVHPEVLAERETDALLVMAFDAQLSGREDESRRCVHQALLLQYCRALGRDGVQLFFKRITTSGHQAQEVFLKDVQETYTKIKVRTAEINKQRAAEKAEGGGGGVEQIQLHAVEPGTVLSFRVPDKESQDPQEQAASAIFEAFTPEMKKAIQSGSLDEVNKVLGELDVTEAEELVGKFNKAGILSLEEEIIDTATEEGKAAFEKRKEQQSTLSDDPE
ncbi:hypothetical protein RB597_006357 [Gaeumannomyces tritici]